MKTRYKLIVSPYVSPTNPYRTGAEQALKDLEATGNMKCKRCDRVLLAIYEYWPAGISNIIHKTVAHNAYV